MIENAIINSNKEGHSLSDLEVYHRETPGVCWHHLASSWFAAGENGNLSKMHTWRQHYMRRKSVHETNK